jgi:isopenicillin N synthase-like dioxygenase
LKAHVFIIDKHSQVGPADPASTGAPARQWPSQPADLKHAWENYYNAMNNLANTLLELCAIGLGLDEHWFQDKTDRNLSALRAL